MEASIIEFKVSQPSLSWCNTQVVYKGLFNEYGADYFAEKIANLFQREVRWNYEGISQGHYIQPDK